MAEPDAPKERDALNVSFADRAAVTPVAERNVLERSSSRSNVAELAERNVMEIERCVTVESPGSSATLSPNRSRPASFQRQRFQFVLDGVELPCEEEYESDDEELVSTWVKLTFWTMFEPCGYTRIFWDLATILMVGYIAVVMPYRLAFKVDARAGKESEIPSFKGSYLGRFPLVLADFWTSDHLSERSRSVGAVSETRARGTLTLKRR